MNYDFFHSLQDNKVKDLYWILFKSSPLKKCPQEFEIALFPEEIIQAWENDSANYFRLLDSSPASLHRFVDRKKNYRLGFYAESLLSYFFQTFSKIQLWVQNFQITNDKQTVGEIDFVIEWKDRIFHIELAVKYYLLLPQENQYIAKNWVGPSRKDNLEKKLKKIQSHQLPLGKHEKLLSLLPKAFKSIMQSYFLFRGQFFANEKVDCDFLNREPFNYIFNRTITNSEEQIVKILNRPDWLSSIDRISQSDVENTNDDSFNKPQMVKFSSNKVGFIVPDDWND
jgi:hypothetical protein